MYFPGFQKRYESLQIFTGYLSFLPLHNDSSYPLYIFIRSFVFFILLCWNSKYVLIIDLIFIYIVSKISILTVFNLWYLWLYRSFSLHVVKPVNLCCYVFWALCIVGKILLGYILEVHFAQGLWKGNLTVFLLHTENSLLWYMLFPLFSFDCFHKKNCRNSEISKNSYFWDS